eukprot:211730_1
MTDAVTVVSLFGVLYDITEFIHDEHPGKLNPKQCGIRNPTKSVNECTALFTSIHSPKTIYKLLQTNNYYDKIKFIGYDKRKPRYSNYIPFWYEELKKSIFTKPKPIITPQMINKARRNILYISTLQLILYFIMWYYILFMYTFNYSHMLNMALVCVCGIFSAHTASIFHTAAHGTFAKTPFIEYYLESFGELVGGLSCFQWKQEHNVEHHQFTNQMEDEQYHQSPFLRLTKCDPYVWHFKYQHIYAWPLYLSVSIKMKSIAICNYSAEKEGYLNGLLMLLNMFMIVFMPCCTFGIINGIIFTLILHIGASIYMVIIFIPNHYVEHCDIAVYEEWPKEQIITSSNVNAGCYITNFFSNGLSHHIEHHLFPNLPHTLYPLIAPIVKKICMDNHIQYKNKSLLEAFVSHYNVLRIMGAS